MEKIVIKAYDPKQIEGTLPEGRVYSREHHAALVSHLQPAIDYLLSIGNELEYPLASWESKSAPVSAMGGGWQQYPHGDFVCLMKKPLDLVALREVFELPSSINFYEDQKVQAITCQEVRASVTHYKL